VGEKRITKKVKENNVISAWLNNLMIKVLMVIMASHLAQPLIKKAMYVLTDLMLCPVTAILVKSRTNTSAKCPCAP